MGRTHSDDSNIDSQVSKDSVEGRVLIEALPHQPHIQAVGRAISLNGGARNFIEEGRKEEEEEGDGQ